MLRRTVLVMIVGLLLPTPFFNAEAANLIFRWVDADGNLHVTDRLGDLPEPYYSMYAAKVKKLEQQEKDSGSSASSSSPAVVAPAKEADRAPKGQSIVKKRIAKRAKWKALVAEWRRKLEVATEHLDRIEAEINKARLNPILRETPKVKKEIALWQGRRTGALDAIARARKMLLEVLPKRVKKENVPPKWLME